MRGIEILFPVASCLLMFTFFPIHAATAQQDVIGRSVDSPREALEVALSYTGFEEIEGLLELGDYDGIRVITFMDSTVPFLAHRVYKRPVWEIYLDSVILLWPGWDSAYALERNPKEFYIVIDSTGGFFIKAYTRWEGEYDPFLDEELPARDAEKSYRREEVFQDFCNQPPPVKMFQALGAAPGSYPLDSKELTILLVRHMYKGDQKPLWHITGRGFPPETIHSIEETPPWNNRSRSVVDAQTGEWLYRAMR